MVEYLNLPRGGGGRGSTPTAPVQRAVDWSWDAGLRWLEANQATVFLVVVALVVGLTLLQYLRARRSRF